MRQILTKLLKPGGTIGIIGGGQLGQMMALSAKEMGFFVGVLDPTKDCPASQVADFSITAEYDNEAAIQELANQSDVVTYEFENVDAAVLEKLVSKDKLPQGTELLVISQNRQNEKEFLESLKLPIAPFKIVKNATDLQSAVDAIGFPSVLKTCTGGYDGKGQVVLKSEQDILEATELLGNQTCVLEAWIPFEKEVSVIVSGTTDENYEIFPIAENSHKNNVLHQSIVPASISSTCEEKAKALAFLVAKALKIKGTVTIEMFVTEAEEIIINEIAPRPHNSGHYSIEACNVSQFDTHIRGICGWPLPKIYQHLPVIMLNLLGDEATKAEAEIINKPDWFFHYYGKKEIKAGRKMGHITILTENVAHSLKEIDTTNIWK